MRPIGNPAPPRPRSVAVEISSITCSRVMPRAFSSAAYPPTARYSESRARSRSSAPARTSCCTSATVQLPDDPGHVLGPGRLAVPVVDDDDRRIPAAAGALDRAQRDLAVLARLARRGRRALARTPRRPAVPRRAHRRRSCRPRPGARRPAPGGTCRRRTRRPGRAPASGRAPPRPRRAPPAAASRTAPGPAASRSSPPTAIRIRRRRRADLLLQAHRSTSPITVSSEPTIAIMSAISEFVMQVAVASSATNDGARNFTRHGFGPPSETT